MADGLPASRTPCPLAIRMDGEAVLSSVGDDRPSPTDKAHKLDAPRRAHLPASPDLEHAVLHLLDASRVPLGSGTLMERLQLLGYHTSEPTVGRFLRSLDRRGLTTRVSNKGRKLTEQARLRLEQLCEVEAQRYYERELIRTIRTSTIDNILDVLVARRALERETARLAAKHASAEEIARLEEAILEQREALATTGIPIDADVKFHSLLARAGKNPVLAAAVDLIRRDKQLTIALDAVLKETEHRWVVGHDRILQAIKRRSPGEAESAMLHHLDSLIAEIQRYRERHGPQVAPARSDPTCEPPP